MLAAPRRLLFLCVSAYGMPYVDRFGWCVDQSRRARAPRPDNAGERFVPHLFPSLFSISDPRRALAAHSPPRSLPFPLSTSSSSTFSSYAFHPFLFPSTTSPLSSVSSSSSPSSSSGSSFAALFLRFDEVSAPCLPARISSRLYAPPLDLLAYAPAVLWKDLKEFRGLVIIHQDSGSRTDR